MSTSGERIEADDLLERLTGYLRGLLDQRDGYALYQTYQDDLAQMTPQLAFASFHRLYADGVPVTALLDILDKAINTFHRALAVQAIKPAPDGLSGILDRENEALLLRLADIRQTLTEKPPDSRRRLLAQVRDLADVDRHYLKKENVLFPLLERKQPYFAGLALMWALHDEIRLRLRQALACLEAPESSDRQVFEVLGRLIFGLHGMVTKERLILLPAAAAVFNASEEAEMLRQGHEYGYAFIESSAPPDHNMYPMPAADLSDGSLTDADPPLYVSETGTLTLTQLTSLFRTLPVDLTVVDEHNQVCYYTPSRERIFPRSPAIIGRQVENCHPPQSVGRVLAIIAAFRTGEKSEASFWIQLRDRFIHIRYFALRDPAGQYRGTLEVSQDITQQRQLEGERRLLDWT
jgi:hypothetical protein